MKIKVHKIKGIDKRICCAEQVIAYRYAAMYVDDGRRIEKSNAPEFIKKQLFDDIVTRVFQSLNADVSDKWYNFDAIIIAFRQGFRRHCENPFIPVNYTEIGLAFPIPGTVY